MDLVEELVRSCARDVTGDMTLQYQGQTFDLGRAFRRISMHDLVREATGLVTLYEKAQYYRC